MRRPLLLSAFCVASWVSACATIARSEPVQEPTLIARAILPAHAYQPGPPSGAGLTCPFGKRACSDLKAVRTVPGQSNGCWEDAWDGLLKGRRS